MHIISQKMLREFWQDHPQAETPLRAWHRVAEQASWETFADVRATYASADQVGKYTVLDIGGHKFRLVVVAHFNRGKIFIRHVLTHKEYDRDMWKGDD